MDQGLVHLIGQLHPAPVQSPGPELMRVSRYDCQRTGFGVNPGADSLQGHKALIVKSTRVDETANLVQPSSECHAISPDSPRPLPASADRQPAGHLFSSSAVRKIIGRKNKAPAAIAQTGLRCNYTIDPQTGAPATHGPARVEWRYSPRRRKTPRAGPLRVDSAECCKSYGRI